MNGQIKSASPLVAVASRVAFQGARGAFSEQAAIELLGRGITLVPRPNFETLFTSIDDGSADLILAPLENSLAGSVRRSFDLLLAGTLHITAEVVIPIHHNLIALPGASFDDVKIVESHPVALAQCERFFAAHPHIKRVAAEDTAGSVAEIMRRNDPTRAAIASKRAASIYGGNILRERLEDHAENYTRFVLLARSSQRDDRADKISLAFRLRNQPGALSDALLPFADREINLLKIETCPIPGEPWQYRFCLDLQASVSDRAVVAALAELRLCADDVRLLGCYKAAQISTEEPHLPNPQKELLNHDR